MRQLLLLLIAAITLSASAIEDNVCNSISSDGYRICGVNSIANNSNSQPPSVVNASEPYDDKDNFTDSTKIFVWVDRYPQFEQCNNIPDEESKKCFNDQLNKHILNNFVYPQEAIDSGISGNSVVEFIISIEGRVKILSVKGRYDILNTAAVNIIKKLPPLAPARYKGRTVAMKFSKPIRFLLED